MLRIDSLSNFFFLTFERFIYGMLNVLSKCALPNIFAAIITAIIFSVILVIKNRVNNKLLSFILILMLVTVQICVISFFITQFGLCSLFCTGIVIMMIVVENF